MDRKKKFIDDLLASMTLEEKVGQFDNPNSEGFAATGASPQGNADILERIRRGAVGTVAPGGGIQTRIEWQKIAVNESPHGIPLAFNEDVIHGYKTIFPVGMASSWDMGLIENAMAVAAREARANGIDITWAPMVDVSEDPRWGRTAENPIECAYLTSRVAVASVLGFQGHDSEDITAPDRMLSIAKHFAGYGFAKAGADYAEVAMGPSDFHRKCLPPFRAAARAGVGGFMVGFHTVDGVPMTIHHELLQKVMMGDWRYKGLIPTDYTAPFELGPGNHESVADMKDAAYFSFRAGVTTELVSQTLAKYLPQIVREQYAPKNIRGEPFPPITEEDVTERCRRVLEAKMKLFWNEQTGTWDPFRFLDEDRAKANTLTEENRKVARQAAADSCILLKNEDNALPLKKDGATIALIGPMAGDDAARNNMQGTWAVSANPADSVTLKEGLERYAGPGTKILYARGSNIVDDPNIAARLNVHNATNPVVTIDGRSAEEMIAEAVATARKADVIVAAVGTSKEHHGESSTRRTIDLPEEQRRLLRALRQVADETGKKLVIVPISGAPLALEEESEMADAMLFSHHPGTEGGNGMAQVLYGDVNPSGKTTMSFPRHSGALPISYADRPSGRPITAIGIDVPDDKETDRHGRKIFRKFTRACGVEGPMTPLYPFGFGKSYTTFKYGPLQVNKTNLSGEGDKLVLSVDVTNTGSHAGKESVQLYKRQPAGKGRDLISHPVRELIGFDKKMIEPGQTETFTFKVTTEDLKFIRARTLSDYDEIWEPGPFIFSVGSSSDDDDLQKVTVDWQDEVPQRQPERRVLEPAI